VLQVYPPIEPACNWLHDALHEIVTEVHERAQANQDQLTWPHVLPLQFRDRLKSRRSLRDALVAYAEVVGGLDKNEHDQMLRALRDQNEIRSLLAGATSCERMEDLPTTGRQPLGVLYRVAFALLDGLEIRTRHERHLISGIGSELCPFCKCESFEPSAKQDLDHFLTRSIYPYAGVNLENLVPMGQWCNERFKGSKDVLRDGDRACTAYFPFGEDFAGIDLNDSDPLGNGDEPRWVIKFIPDDDRTETWNRIFLIKTRYKSILESSYKMFLAEFRGVWEIHCGSSPDRTNLIDALAMQAKHKELESGTSRAFLAAAAFRMLEKNCREGNQQLIELLVGVGNQRVSA
jgi:hypothetical protein